MTFRSTVFDFEHIPQPKLQALRAIRQAFKLGLGMMAPALAALRIASADLQQIGLGSIVWAASVIKVGKLTYKP